MDKRQTIIYKTLHRKLKIKQTPEKTGKNPFAPERKGTQFLLH
jgi:hypothetical protein